MPETLDIVIQQMAQARFCGFFRFFHLLVQRGGDISSFRPGFGWPRRAGTVKGGLRR